MTSLLENIAGRSYDDVINSKLIFQKNFGEQHPNAKFDAPSMTSA